MSKFHHMDTSTVTPPNLNNDQNWTSLQYCDYDGWWFSFECHLFDPSGHEFLLTTKQNTKENYTSIRNNHCMNSDHLDQNDEFGLHHEPLCDIVGWQRSVSWPDLQENKVTKIQRQVKYHSRQSPHTRKFFVIWMNDVSALATKFQAIASFSLCPQRTDSIVSSSASGRVIHDESYSWPCSISSREIFSSST